MGVDLFLDWFVETTLAMSALTAVVLLVRKPFAARFGARAAYALWLAPFARLFLPELKLLPAPPAPAVAALSEPASTFYLTASPTGAVASAPELGLGAVAVAALCVVWAFGAIAWILHQLERQRRYIDAMRAASAPARGFLIAEARDVARRIGLKQAPELRVMSGAETDCGPCVAGLARPVVFLPHAFADDFSAAERRLTLAHEFAHIARGDLLAAFAAAILRAFQWPNPLAHAAWRAFRIDQEAACDAYVLARCAGATEKGDYASAIIKSLKIGAANSAPAFGLTLSHPVKERLMLLKNPNATPGRLLAGAAAVALLTAAGLAATASYGHAADRSAPEAPQKTRRTITVMVADKGETMILDGEKRISKFYYENENGTRTLRIYDLKGKMTSEDIYEPGEDMPERKVVFTGKNGEKKEMTIGAEPVAPEAPLPPAAPEGAAMKRVMILDGDDLEGDFDLLAPEDGERRIMVFKNSDGDDMEFEYALSGEHQTSCVATNGEDAIKIEWADGGDGDRIVEKQVICLTGDDAKPENRAAALRKLIARMEADARRDAERRKEMIMRMKEELKKAEKK